MLWSAKIIKLVIQRQRRVQMRYLNVYRGTISQPLFHSLRFRYQRDVASNFGNCSLYLVPRVCAVCMCTLSLAVSITLIRAPDNKEHES